MTPPRRTRELGTIATTVEHSQSGAVVKSKAHTDHVPIEDVGDHPGYVMVKGGATKNMGDYQSISVQVSIGMPCKASMEAAKAKYEEIAVVVDELIQKELKLAMEGDTEAQPNV